MELAITTFIILLIIPFITLFIALRETQPTYEYVKIGFMCLTAILFIISSVSFISTTNISMTYTSVTPDAVDELTSVITEIGSESGTGTDTGTSTDTYTYIFVNGSAVVHSIASTSEVIKDSSDQTTLTDHTQKHAGSTNIKFTAFDMVNKFTFFNGDPNVYTRGVTAPPDLTSYLYVVDSDNEVLRLRYLDNTGQVGSFYDALVLSGVYGMIGILVLLFFISEVFRIPKNTL